jgi:hypothetical protein
LGFQAGLDSRAGSGVSRAGCFLDNSPKAIARRLAKLDEEFRAFLRDAPWKHDSQPPHPEDKPQQEHDGGPRKVEIVPPSPKDASHANHTDTKTKSFPWWRITEGVGILAAVVVAGVNVFQWRDAQKNFKADERAWIGFRIANIVRVEPRQVMEFEVVVTNTGRTPGHIDKGTTTMAMRTKSEDIYQFGSSPLDYDTSLLTGEISQIMLFPQGETRMPAISPHPLTDSEAAALDTGNARLRLSGTIHYTDIFGGHHTTDYCFVWVPPAAKFNACKNHNDAD